MIFRFERLAYLSLSSSFVSVVFERDRRDCDCDYRKDFYKKFGWM